MLYFYYISEPDTCTVEDLNIVEDYVDEEDDLEDIEKLSIATFLRNAWEEHKLDMLVDREIGTVLAEGRFTMSKANPLSLDSSLTKVTTRLQTSATENEISRQFLSMRSKRSGKLFKEVILNSCNKADILTAVVAELLEDYHGKQKNSGTRFVFKTTVISENSNTVI